MVSVSSGFIFIPSSPSGTHPLYSSCVCSRATGQDTHIGEKCSGHRMYVCMYVKAAPKHPVINTYNKLCIGPSVELLIARLAAKCTKFVLFFKHTISITSYCSTEYYDYGNGTISF